MVVTNCVTDGVSGGVDVMEMIGMLVVVMTFNFHHFINCISVYHFNQCKYIILKNML